MENIKFALELGICLILGMIPIMGITFLFLYVGNKLFPEKREE